MALLPPRATTSNVRRLFHQPTLARYRRAGAAGPLGTMLFILVVVAAIVVRSGVRRSATYNGHPWHDTPVVGGHHRRWGYGVPEHSLLAPPRERDGDTAAGSGRRNWVVIIGIAPTAAAVLLVQGLLHGHLSAVDEYDDGVYFGASVELVHGVMAYRSFAFIQPPMITVWMLPFAAASRVVGTAPAMESARFFVDLVTVANMVLVGELVRHRSTLQVAVATGVMAFSLGTIRASQTILLEPFLVLACLLAFLCLADGEGLTTSPRRLWWCGVFLGVGGATKIWAVFPLVAVLIVLRGAGFSWQRTVFGGATLGFVICCLPFIAGAPTMSFTQVVLTQALRNGGGYPLLPRLADLTGIPGLASFAAPHSGLSVIVLSAAVALASVTILVGRRTHRGPSWTPLDRLAGWPAGRLAGWSTLIVGAGLSVSPTYYYHYSGFLAPFVALSASAAVVRIRAPLQRLFTTQQRRRPGLLALVAAPTVIVLLLSGSVNEILNSPAAPHVGDMVSDAIPSHGCVLYANPTLALLDDRFTSDVSGCPNVIDWLGQERVLDNGHSVSVSDAANRHLQGVISRWIESSDAVVLEKSNLGLDVANVSYLTRHFHRQRDVPRGLRIYVRPTDRQGEADAAGRTSGRTNLAVVPPS